MSDKLSKSKRVREYLTNNPGVRNRDVVAALSEFGVTAADVSNAKFFLKSTTSKSRSRSRLSRENSEPVATDPIAPEQHISVSEVEATLAYLRRIGSIDRARQLLQIVEHIQKLPSR